LQPLRRSPGGGVGNGARSFAAPHDLLGFSLVELLIVVAIIALIGAATVPRITAGLDEARARGAAFYVSSRFALARTLAAQRNANVAFRFEPQAGSFRVRTFMDTNGNGVRTAEIARGIDVAILADERLDHLFSGVHYGFVAGARLIDGTAVTEGDDPIRFGATDMLIFTPSGTATAGTAYIRSDSGSSQFAVIVLGATGRTRIGRFDLRTHEWTIP
jgi:prepilin-type N-terminal cleavage/methylation domain-containing protein